MDVASPRCSLSEIPAGGIPLLGEDGAFVCPTTYRLKRQILKKGKITKFKGEMAILDQILARWPFWNAKMIEMKAQKAKIKGNESPKNQNESK